jgi:hypothetical protein
MSLQFSESVRNTLLDSWQDVLGNSAKIKIWSGTLPVNVATAPAGSVICEFDLDIVWAPSADNGQKELLGLPLQTTATASGIASFFRVYSSDGITCHTQGTVGMSQSGEDVILDNTNIRTNQVVRLTNFTLIAPGL